jgi:KaiC/GvpD/RAD55 family RecA-like ATPase
MIERVPSGIPGLDQLLGGGFVKRRHTLVCGGPGTGKTTLGFEFLYRGANKYGDKGLFLSLEQSPARVVESAKNLFHKWDWDKQLEENILVTRLPIEDFKDTHQLIKEYVEKNNVKRVVIDSLTIMRLYFRNEDAYRNNLYELMNFMAEMDCTSLMTLEKTVNKRTSAQYQIEEFISDGVINLYHVPKERDRVRVLEIIKMRDTDHSTRLSPFKITSEGLMISPDAQMFGNID